MDVVWSFPSVLSGLRGSDGCSAHTVGQQEQSPVRAESLAVPTEASIPHIPSELSPVSWARFSPTSMCLSIPSGHGSISVPQPQFMKDYGVPSRPFQKRGVVTLQRFHPMEATQCDPQLPHCPSLRFTPLSPRP